MSFNKGEKYHTIPKSETTAARASTLPHPFLMDGVFTTSNSRVAQQKSKNTSYTLGYCRHTLMRGLQYCKPLPNQHHHILLIRFAPPSCEIPCPLSPTFVDAAHMCHGSSSPASRHHSTRATKYSKRMTRTDCHDTRKQAPPTNHR